MNSKLHINLTILKFSIVDGLNIIMVIAIILFARLGVRLYVGYKKYSKEEKDEKDDSDI